MILLLHGLRVTLIPCWSCGVVEMTNVTLSVDEEDLKQARVLALEHGTSLNAVIREFIKDYIGRTKRYRQVTERILRAAEHSHFDSGGRGWTRDELHER